MVVATGGALGGVFVAVVAPSMFSGYWEYPLALIVTATLVLGTLFCDPASPLLGGRRPAAWTVMFAGYAVLIAVLGARIASCTTGRCFMVCSTSIRPGAGNRRHTTGGARVCGWRRAITPSASPASP
jgi:hypothetical protein